MIRKLALEDKVLAIIGPNTSGEGEVAFPVVAQLGVPLVSTSTAKGGIMKLGLADGKQWAFRNVAPDDQNTTPVMEKVIKEQGIKTLG
ncbi:MAG: ABC transporter substrate-binding protein [Chloroflexi bacterium]|nr:ABC transporter substrate-binding protein [Chloroflexota bacterium]